MDFQKKMEIPYLVDKRFIKRGKNYLIKIHKLLIFLRAFYVPLTFLYVRYMQRLKQNGAKRKMFVLSLFYHVDLGSVIWQIRDSDFNKKQLFCNHFQTKEKN